MVYPNGKIGVRPVCPVDGRAFCLIHRARPLDIMGTGGLDGPRSLDARRPGVEAFVNSYKEPQEPTRRIRGSLVADATVGSTRPEGA